MKPASSTARGRSTMRTGVGAPGSAARACATSPAIAKDSSRRPSCDGRRDHEHLEAARLEVGPDHLGELARLGDVDLVQDDDAGRSISGTASVADR